MILGVKITGGDLMVKLILYGVKNIIQIMMDKNSFVFLPFYGLISSFDLDSWP